MKKRFGILLAIIVLLLVLTVAVACDPKDKTPEVQKYEIKFESNGGSEVKSVVAEAGSDISELLPKTEPTKDGVFFGGWSLENNGFASKAVELPTKMPEENVTYYARWTWHAIIVPKLQPLAGNVPDTNEANFTASPKDSFTVEVDPQAPTFKLYDDAGKKHNVKGYKASSAQNSDVTLHSKEETFYLNYTLNRYKIAYYLTNKVSGGQIAGVFKYLGEKLEMPELPSDTEVPPNLRFAGWSSDENGEKDFAAAGSEITIGEEGSPVGGESSDSEEFVYDCLLYAVFDEAYIDFSNGTDYVFIPKHEKGVAYVRRAELDILEGTYVPNPNVSETSPHLGMFTCENKAGTTLNGFVYDDGHFAYEQTSIDPSWQGVAIMNYSMEENMPVEGNKLTLIDCYGCAVLELASPITIGFGEDAYTLEAGKHIGGYWYDSSFEDYCFTVADQIDGNDYLFDFHFQFVQITSAPEQMYFAFEGKEAGIYFDSISSAGTFQGDMLILDGYGEAISIIGNSQYTGQYFRVGEGAFYASLYNSVGDYRTILFRVDLSDIVTYNQSTNMPIRLYSAKNDGSLFVQCANEDGSEFYSDGFGNGTYKRSDGTEISGKAELVGEMFETTTPAVAFKLTESGGAAHYFILDYFMTANNSIDARFTHLTSASEVNVKYLYNTSVNAGEYVGAIVTAGNEAYYLTAVTTSAGNVIFSDINKGTVSSKDGSYLFKSAEYVISYEDDEVRTMRYDTPTVTTSQMKLGELTFSVFDGDKDLGKLTVTGGEDGKATYRASKGRFENAEFEFAYSSIIVKQEQNASMFVVDKFGTEPKAYATEKKDFLVGGVEEPQGELYMFKQEGKDRAMLWMLMYGEMHFYAIADISEAENATTKPLNSDETVYLIDTLLASYYAVKTKEGNYLAPNTTLRSGTFTITDGTTPGEDEIQLDAYGAVKYTDKAKNKTFEGSYKIVDGVYSVTFNEVEDAPEAFNFMLSSTYFIKVDYSEFYVVNPATLGVNSILRIKIKGGTAADIENKEAELFRAAEDSNGNVSRGSSALAKGTITSEGDGIYKFSGRSDESLSDDDMIFTFRFDEYIFTQKVFVRNNVTLPTGEFKEDAADAQTKKIALDEYGRATYSDGSTEHVGFYFIDGGIYRFVDDADREFDLQFTLNIAEQRLIIYGAEAKPFAGGDYDLTYDESQYKLSIMSEGETLKAILKNSDGSAVVATDEELEMDEYGIYTFNAVDASGKSYVFKFIISKGRLVMEDLSLSYQIPICVGNLWLYKEQNIARLGDIGTLIVTAYLTVRGFNEVAEIMNTTEIIKGSISTEEKDGYKIVTFTDEYGNTQELYDHDIKIPIENAQTKALFVESSEKGLAIEYYYTMGASGKAVAYFDGLGKAYKLDDHDQPTSEVIGYYFFDNSNLIYVGTFENKTFNVNDIYAPYGLRLTQLDGSSENVTGVVAYDAKYDTIAIADDGSIFIFDGFDGVTYVDSLGKVHSGYFNNYGEMTTGTPDGRYLITDEYDNATLYFIDFKEVGEEDRTAIARKASYVVYTPYPNVYAEVQFMSADDYNKPDGESDLPDEVPDGKQGFAILVILIDGEQGAFWGFYTIEGGLMIIEVYDQDGKATGDRIELALYVDGTADWNNSSEWLSSSAE